MNPDLISAGDAVFAPLPQFSTLSVSGADARVFLHSQLSNDIEHLAPEMARRAGYCSAKGRMLASLLVIPHAGGFVLQVARDISAAITKRLSMYVLRSKVKVIDASDTWTQFGAWGPHAAARLASCGVTVPVAPMQVTHAQDRIVVCLDAERFLIIASNEFAALLAGRMRAVTADGWTLAEVRAGIPLITLATQDQFVPQMTNFELIGGIDFKKGCYPGQEIIARSQYLGKLKRRMYRGAIEACAAPAPGQDLFGADSQASGMIVNVAPRPEGGYEFLAVIQSAAVEADGPIRVGAPDGPIAHIVPLPYAL